MGSPLRGQIDKLSFRRLVCGDWRTPAKNYNAFVVFMAPWFWLGAPWHRIVPKSMNWSLLRQNYQRRNPWRNLKKRFARAVNSLQELLTLFWTYSSVQIPAGRHLGLFVKGISSISLPGFDGHRLFCEESSPFRAKSTFLCPCWKWKYEFACVTNVIHAFPNAWEPIITPKRFAEHDSWEKKN